MKSVLISISPKWCELIASGKKTIEVRKTRPKISMPFKCYIYCTGIKIMNLRDYVVAHQATGGAVDDWSGKVIGEFVCDNVFLLRPYTYDGGSADLEQRKLIQTFEGSSKDNEILSATCLSQDEIFDYIGVGNYGYGWHISDLKIYDKPKELGNFWKADKCPYATESGCTYKHHCFRAGQTQRCGETLTRPPQSWCYVEEV